MIRRTIIFLVIIFSFQAVLAETSNHPGAKELLDNFAKTHEVFNSFTAKTEVSYQFTTKSFTPQLPSSHQKVSQIIDFRYDLENKRTNTRRYKYGDVHPSSPPVPKSNPCYTSSLFIDKQFDRWYGRSNITSDPGRANLQKNPYPDPQNKTTQALSRGFKGHECLGYLYGNDERIDNVLRDTKTIRVQKKMRKVGGYNCYVIEATTDGGEYTLWIDPEHGYNLAKAKYLVKEGDSFSGSTVKKGERYYTSLDKVKFKKVDGTWVPVEAEILYDWKIPGKYNYRETIQYKAKEYQLNPDHEALGSFDSDDIQNGAKFRITDSTGVSVITYYWQDGELIPNIDKSAIDAIDSMAEEVLTERTGRKAGAANNPSAFELLDKFSETQEKTKSFTLKKEGTQKGKVSYWNNVPTEMFFSSEIRFDGKRFNSRSTSWGHINPKCILEKENAGRTIDLWNGKDFYQYNKAYDDNTGHLIIRQHSGSNDQIPALGPLMIPTSGIGPSRGYLPQEVDRIDAILRNAASLRVRDKMEKVGDSSCYVIEAKTSSGRYKIWIDPEHSYQIAKAEVRKGPGDVVFKSKYKLPEGDHIRSFVDNVHFEKKGGVWIPMQWRTGLSRKTPGGGSSTQINDSKITEFELNPDHELLKSFEADFIPDGTKVRVGKGGEKEFVSIKYIWQDGKLIPDIEEEAIDQIDRMAEEVLSERAVRKAGAANNPSAFELLDKFVESQKKLKSYIIKSNTKSTYSYTGVAPFNGRGTTYRHSDVRFDGDRVKESLTHWGDQGHRILDLPKENAEYTSCLWDGETGYELSLVQKNRRQTAKHPGLVQIYKKGSRYADYAKETYKRTMISPAQGYVMGNDQDIGTMFLRADAKVKLLDKRSKVNEVDCYVIEAEVPKGGKYKVWIDPVHDFNLARLRSRRKTGDLYYGRPLNEDVHWNNFYEVVEFQEVGDVWLPKTFKTKANGHDGGYDFDHQEETQTELYEVNLDPDHDKEGSFLTDDILNGTQVRLEGHPLNVILTWQDGEFVPDVDEAPIDQLDKMTAEILAEGKKRKVSPGKAVASDSVTLSRILAEYAKSQKQIASFYCVSNTSSKEQKATLSRYACDGSRFSVKVKAAQGVDGFVWDGKQSIHSSGDSGRFRKVLASADKKKPYQLLAAVYPGAALLGYLNGRPERIDAILSKVSKEATVTEEKLNCKSCYVVHAQVGKDVYRVWFLPENGYHIARAEVKAGSKVVYLLDQMRFKKVEDNWVPMSCAVKDSTRQYSYKRTKIDLKPDFEKLKAFGLPISNGTPVTIENKSGKFVWRNGHVVDKEGKDVL